MRGKGLLNAIVIKEQGGVNAYDVCMKLKESGLLVSDLQGLRALSACRAVSATSSSICFYLLGICAVQSSSSRLMHDAVMWQHAAHLLNTIPQSHSIWTTIQMCCQKVFKADI